MSRNQDLERILCYARPWNREQMIAIARAAAPLAEISVCSDHRHIDDTRLWHSYYDLLEESADDLVSPDEIPPDAVNDIILRCRVLRELPRPEALRLISAMSRAVRNVLSETRPSSVLSITVDSFVVDLLRYHSEDREVPFIGMVPTFVNGYFRVTSRGEKNENPDPPDGEEEILDVLLEKYYSPAFTDPARKVGRGVLAERWFRNVLRWAYHGLKIRFGRDRLNHHSLSARFQASQWLAPTPVAPRVDEDWSARLARDARPSIFIPLQKFPEATVDYWCPDVDVIRYGDVLTKLVEHLGEAFHLVFKEHPNVLGMRPSGFYEMLRGGEPRVTFAPTFTHSNEVLALTDCVLVWTGTVGFEAALRGTAVCHLGSPYYATGPRFLRIGPDSAIDAIRRHIEVCSATPIERSEQLELVRHLVQQLFKGRFRNDGSWRRNRAVDREDATTMGKSLRPLLQRVSEVG